jgi:WD40 repeat protein
MQARHIRLLAVALMICSVATVSAEPLMDAQGDALPAGAMSRLGTSRFRAGGEVKALLYSADGRALIAGSPRGTIRFWDAQTGAELRSLTGHEHPVTCLALSADGKTLASGSLDQTARLWDVASGKQLCKVTSQRGWITAVALSPDGKTLACASTGTTVGLYDTRSGDLVRTLQGRGVWGTALAFSRDGKTLVSSTKDHIIRCWDTGSGEEATQFDEILAYALAVSPDGKTLAAASSDYVVYLWDMETGKERFKLEGHEASVYAVAYAPDGRTLASADCAGKVRIWDAATGKVRQAIEAEEEGGPLAIAVSPDGKTIASVGVSQTIRRWETGTGKPVGGRSPGEGGPILGLTFTADGRELISNSRDATVRLWTVATCQQRLSLRGHRQPPFASVLSADGKTLATLSEDRSVRTWALADGSAGPVYTVEFGETIGLMFLDGVLHACATANNNLELRDLTGSRPRQLFQVDLSRVQVRNRLGDRVDVGWPGHTGRLSTVAVSHGGTLIATGGHDKNIVLWEAGRGKLLHKMSGHQGGIAALEFSGDDRLLISRGSDGMVRLWEVATRRPLAFLPLMHGIRVAALSPDCRTLAWASSADDRVHLWDLVHNRELPLLTGHSEPINALAFSPDGRLLASGSLDTTVLLWDVRGLLDRARFDAVADIREPEDLWLQLASDEAATGYAAVWALARSKPDQTLALLKQRLKLEQAKQQTAAELIDALDSGAFQVRRRATEALESMGEIVRPDLVKALATKPSFEKRQRLEQILRALDNRQGRLAPDEVRQVRSVLILEWLATAESRQFLQQVAKGPPGWWQTSEAKAALERQAKRAAP